MSLQKINRPENQALIAHYLSDIITPFTIYWIICLNKKKFIILEIFLSNLSEPGKLCRFYSSYLFRIHHFNIILHNSDSLHLLTAFSQKNPV